MIEQLVTAESDAALGRKTAAQLFGMELDDDDQATAFGATVRERMGRGQKIEPPRTIVVDAGGSEASVHASVGNPPALTPAQVLAAVRLGVLTPERGAELLGETTATAAAVRAPRTPLAWLRWQVSEFAGGWREAALR